MCSVYLFTVGIRLWRWSEIAMHPTIFVKSILTGIGEFVWYGFVVYTSTCTSIDCASKWNGLVRLLTKMRKFSALSVISLFLSLSRSSMDEICVFVMPQSIDIVGGAVVVLAIAMHFAFLLGCFCLFYCKVCVRASGCSSVTKSLMRHINRGKLKNEK